jgi:hypothetical protein
MERSIWHYIIISWIAPALLALLLFGLDFTPIPRHLKPMFGTPVCWFNNTEAMVFYFVIPFITIMLCNGVFFVMTCITLRSTFTSVAAKARAQQKGREVKIYTKLFIISGLSWLSGIIATVVQSEAVWYIFVILNASQGVFMLSVFMLRRYPLTPGSNPPGT